jgi:hypothetical protein
MRTRCPIRTFLSFLSFVMLIAIVAGAIWWKPWEEQPRSPDELDRLLTLAQAGSQEPGSLAHFWKARLRKDDATTEFHQPAAFQAYQVPDVPASACDSLRRASEGRNNAFYCSADEKISWDSDFLELLYQLLGSIAPLAILAHEYGHHISHLRGDLANYSVQEELQADCFAGMYVRSAAKNFQLSAFSVLPAALSFYRFGDDPKYASTDWFVVDAHGSPKERLRAFNTGFIRNSLERCVSYLHFRSDSTAQVGPFSLAVAQGTKLEPHGDTQVSVTSDAGSASVSYLDTAEGEPNSSKFGRLVEKAWDLEGVSGESGRFYGPPRSRLFGYEPQLSRRYELVYQKDGTENVRRGVLLVIALVDGGAVGFNVFEPGYVETADPDAWKDLERYAKQLRNGIWPNVEPVD